MVDIENGIIVIGVKPHKIKSFDVWFLVEGKGLFTTMETALIHGEEVAPIPVAVAEDGFYEVLPAVVKK